MNRIQFLPSRATAFIWKDKCAAGIGPSMESFADLMERGITEIGSISLQSDKFRKLSDFCRYMLSPKPSI